METNYLDFIILVCAACIVFIVCISFIFRSACTGVLEVDKEHFDKEVYRFSIKELEKIDKKDYIVLKIDHNADLREKN